MVNTIRKRDGRIENFDKEKIVNAIYLGIIEYLETNGYL